MPRYRVSVEVEAKSEIYACMAAMEALKSLTGRVRGGVRVERVEEESNE